MPHRHTDFDLVNGNITITLTPDGREFMAAALADGGNVHSEQLMHELFEWQCCNGWEWIAPEELGALTDAPILSDSAERDDDGVLTRAGRIYWFSNYQVESAVQALYARGKVTFEGVAFEDAQPDAWPSRLYSSRGASYHTRRAHPYWP